MVKWKGEIDSEVCGSKAAKLDEIENFDVPNFFVITRKEVADIVNGSQTREELINSELSDRALDKIKEAYEEVGMSSEVREAPGEARNLVNQRNSQLVSVRVSDSEKGCFESRLNVGSSGLENALKEVIASYFESETKFEYPAIIVQKMVEPEYTGAAITPYIGGYQLLEAVKGLGHSLERGLAEPSFYLLKKGRVEETRVPEKQVAVRRNQMTGDHEKKIDELEKPFEDEEIEELFQKLDRENYNIKFVFKRGSFYVVDAFERRNTNPFENESVNLNGIRVSEGGINGRVGGEITFAEETVPPNESRAALISKKGGFTSTDAQLTREKGKPGIFSFKDDLSEGQKVSFGKNEVSLEKVREEDGETNETGFESNTAFEVLPVNDADGIQLSGFEDGKYVVGGQRKFSGTKIPESGLLTNYKEVLNFEGDKLVLDARNLENDGLKGALEYLDADLMVLVLDDFSSEIIRKAVSQGFDVFGSSENLKDLERILEREERRFIIERLRDLSK